MTVIGIKFAGRILYPDNVKQIKYAKATMYKFNKIERREEKAQGEPLHGVGEQYQQFREWKGDRKVGNNMRQNAVSNLLQLNTLRNFELWEETFINEQLEQSYEIDLLSLNRKAVEFDIIKRLLPINKICYVDRKLADDYFAKINEKKFSFEFLRFSRFKDASHMLDVMVDLIIRILSFGYWKQTQYIEEAAVAVGRFLMKGNFCDLLALPLVNKFCFNHTFYVKVPFKSRSYCPKAFLYLLSHLAHGMGCINLGRIFTQLTSTRYKKLYMLETQSGNEFTPRRWMSAQEMLDYSCKVLERPHAEEYEYKVEVRRLDEAVQDLLEKCKLEAMKKNLERDFQEKKEREARHANELAQKNGNWKGRWNEMVMEGIFKKMPEIQTIKNGPDHKLVFTVKAFYEEFEGMGIGRTLKEAEQDAYRLLLRAMNYVQLDDLDGLSLGELRTIRAAQITKLGCKCTGPLFCDSHLQMDGLNIEQLKVDIRADRRNTAQANGFAMKAAQWFFPQAFTEKGEIKVVLEHKFGLGEKANSFFGYLKTKAAGILEFLGEGGRHLLDTLVELYDKVISIIPDSVKEYSAIIIGVIAVACLYCLAYFVLRNNLGRIKLAITGIWQMFNYYGDYTYNKVEKFCKKVFMVEEYEVQGFSNVAGGLIAMLSSIMFGGDLNHKHVSNFNNLVRAGGSIAEVIEWSMTNSQKLVAYAAEQVLGRPVFSERKLLEKYRELYETWKRLKNEIDGLTKFVKSDVKDEVIDFNKEVFKYYPKIVESKAFIPDQKRWIHQAMFDVQRWSQEVLSFGRTAKPRTPPTRVNLVGATATGKSYQTNMFLSYLYHLSKKWNKNLVGDFNTSQIYERQAEEEFWSNYHSQWAVTIQDWLQSKDPEIRHKQAMEEIAMGGNTPWPLIMPDLVSKGTTFFDSSYVFSTSNVLGVPEDLQLVSTEAFTRRIDTTIIVIVNKEFATNPDASDLERRFDISKVQTESFTDLEGAWSYYLVEDLQKMGHERENLLDVHGSLVRGLQQAHQKAKKMTFREVCARIDGIAKARYTHSGNYDKMLQTKWDIEPQGYFDHFWPNELKNFMDGKEFYRDGGLNMLFEQRYTTNDRKCLEGHNFETMRHEWIDSKLTFNDLVKRIESPVLDNLFRMSLYSRYRMLYAIYCVNWYDTKEFVTASELFAAVVIRADLSELRIIDRYEYIGDRNYTWNCENFGYLNTESGRILHFYLSKVVVTSHVRLANVDISIEPMSCAYAVMRKLGASPWFLALGTIGIGVASYIAAQRMLTNYVFTAQSSDPKLWKKDQQVYNTGHWGRGRPKVPNSHLVGVSTQGPPTKVLNPQSDYTLIKPVKDQMADAKSKWDQYVAEAQGQDKSAHELFVQKICRNYRDLFIYYKDGQKYEARIFFIGGRVAFSAGHMFVPPIEKIGFGNIDGGGGETMLSPLQYKVKFFEGVDICRIVFDGTIGQTRSLVKHLWDFDEDLTEVMPVRVDYDIQGGSTWMTNGRDFEYMAELKAADTLHKATFVSRDVVWVNGIKGEKGHCGLVYITLDNKVRKKIIGMHVAGHHVLGSACLPIRLRYLEGLTEDDKRPLGKLPTLVSQMVETQGFPPFMPHLHPYARLKNKSYMNDKSKIIPSQFMTGVTTLDGVDLKCPFKITKAPARLDKFKGKDGEEISPLWNGLRKYRDVHTPMYDERFLEIVSDPRNFESMIDWKQGDPPLEILTEREAIIGSIPYNMNGLEWSSSPGLPHTLKGHKKTDLVTVYYKGKEIKHAEINPVLIQDYEVKLHPDLRSILDDQYSSLEKGKVPCDYAQLTEKDELRDLARVVAGSTRLFLNMNTASQIINKRVFGIFVNKLANMRHKGAAQVGINVHSFEWALLYSRLTAYGGHDRLGGGDFSRFDISVKLRFLYEFAKWFTRYYRTEDREFVTLVIYSIFQPVIIMPQGIYQSYEQQCSGHWMTATLNSLYNEWIHRIAWRLLAPQELEFKFSLYVMLVVYGDDSGWGAKQECVKWWNMKQLQKVFLKYFGMEYTSPTKEEAFSEFLTLENFSFLKRKFRIDGPFVYPTLDKESIEQSLLYVNRSTKKEQDDALYSSCRSATIEAFYYGRTYFDDLVKIMQPRLLAIDPSFILPWSYDDLHHRWTFGMANQ